MHDTHEDAEEPRAAEHDADLHRHEHAHEDVAHRHPHHHRVEQGPAHEHTHTLGYERYTYLISPVHDLDPRFKIVSALLLVVGVVAGPPMRAPEFILLAIFLLAITVLARLPLPWMLARSAIVLPVALGIALFAPLGQAESFTWAGIAEAYETYSWLIWSIASKAWFSAYVVLLLSATTPMPRLFKGLQALKVPEIFLTLLTFLYRFTDVFIGQLTSMRRAVASRAPGLSRWGHVRLYGNLAGNLFIRSYERGERVYAAMLSRGYTGVLPTAETLASRPADWLAVATALIVVLAALLY